MDRETEDHRDQRGKSDKEEEESHDAEVGDDGSEDSTEHEDAEELGGEDSPGDNSDNSEDSDEEYSDDGSRPVEDGDFEDKKDRKAFSGTDLTKDEYLNEVLPLKHNDENLTEFCLWGKDLSNEAWARLGMFLRRNTHLSQIHIQHCNLTANKLALLFGSGPCNNNSIEILILEDNPIGSEGVTALKPFFKTASSLTRLDLQDTNLGPEGFRLLSLELGGLPNLKHLSLNNNNIGDEGLEGISMLCFSKLTELYLGGNGIGRRGCDVIANLLRSDESALVELYLHANAIDDECAEILATSILHNTNLEELGLIGNDNISCMGWESFRRLVCDTTSLSATHKSNHTLRGMLFSYTPRTQPIIQQLKRVLRDNGRPGTLHDKACRKIMKHHFEKGNNPGPLLDMNVQLMPHVFSWISHRSDEDFGDGCRNNFVYQILRTLNVRAFVPKDIAPP